MTTTVLVTGIGGSIGIDVARSLRRDAPDSIRLLGSDSSEWGRRLGRRFCDEVVELPRADREPLAFAEALNQAIRTLGVDYSFINPDPEIEALVGLGRAPAGVHSLPGIDLAARCIDKAATVEAATGGRDLFPATRRLEAVDDVDEIFRELGSPLWLRATVGPGGRGSLPVREPGEVRAWVDYWSRREREHEWVLQEFLPGRNINWTGIFDDGKLVAQAAMERLSYFLAAPTVSGISGQVALCATVDPMLFAPSCRRALESLVSKPTGLFSVDLRGDEEGAFKITEINPRLAGRPWLYTAAGVNVALEAVRTALARPVGRETANQELALGLHLYRQLDVEPVIGYPDDDR